MTSQDPFRLEANEFALRMGARPLDGEPLILLDPATMAEQLRLKAQILAEDHRYVCQALPGSELAQWEVLELLLPALARHYPHAFRLELAGAGWHWHNQLSGEHWALNPTAQTGLALAPLDWIGRQVQEDLLLLAGDAEAGFPLVAGHLCFANHWCLDEKLGLPLLAIHAPVPGYAEQLGRPGDMLLARLKPERPVWRRNWSLVISPQFDLSSRYRAQLDPLKATITSANAGERCYYRTERQTLSRLPRSGAVLFTIHTHRAPLASLAADPAWAAGLLGMLRSTPPAMIAYKGLTPYYEPLCAYLISCAE